MVFNPESLASLSETAETILVVFNIREYPSAASTTTHYRVVAILIFSA